MAIVPGIKSQKISHSSCARPHQRTCMTDTVWRLHNVLAIVVLAQTDSFCTVVGVNLNPPHFSKFERVRMKRSELGECVTYTLWLMSQWLSGK